MGRSGPAGARRDYTPAAGVAWLAPVYDLGIAWLTREQRWRAALLEQVNPHVRDVIVDVGCGTGSWLLLAARAAPGAALVGIDPDPEILARARAKAHRATVQVEWLQGYADQVPALLGDRRITKIVCSLMFHHLLPDDKRRAFTAFHAALPAGGELYVADYGLQRSLLMRALFRGTVQRLDGLSSTESNARGVLPGLMREAGFVEVRETQTIPTATGSLSLYRGTRPG